MDNTPNGACGMPQKQPQKSSPQVLPPQRTTGTVTPAQPNVANSQPSPPAGVPPAKQ
jgi:hypothetical protein